MMRFAAVLTAALALGAGAFAADAKTVTVSGTLVCGKCKLGETKTCSNVLLVKDGEKTTKFYLTDAGNGEDYHEGVCGGGEKPATVTGTTTEKDGKTWLKPTKVAVK